MTYDQSAYAVYPSKPNHQLQLYVRRDQVSGNSSSYAWQLIARRTSGVRSWYNDPLGYSVNIGGQIFNGSAGLPFNTAEVILASGTTGWFGHDGNGYLNIYFSALHGGGGFGVAQTSTTLFQTDRIPQPPGAPHSNTISNVGPTSFRQTFSGSGVDLGGGSFYAWQAQIATNSAFTTDTQLVNSSGTTDWSGLPNHTPYWSRSRAVTSVGAGAWSNVSTTTTLGHPTAPLSLAAIPSTTTTGTIALTWSAPATTGVGGITGYNIFRDGVQIATTTGTGTGYTDTGLTGLASYTYTVAARNAYSNSVSSMGPQTAGVVAVAPGPPNEPTGLTAVADGLVPGKVDLSWTAPTTPGAGGITGYRIYFAGGALIANQNGTGTTYSVTGLAPGTTYSFQVFARNALGDTEGTMSPGSNTPTVTPIGEPTAPTSVTAVASPTTANRIVVSWTAPAGTLTGYSIFRRVSGVDTLLAKINATHTSYADDNQTAGSNQTYVVRARTAYTDTLSTGYPGNWGGVASDPVTVAASNNSDQAVPSLSAATSSTNAAFNGTFTVTAVTSNTISYTKVNANIVPVASGGTVANNTNAIYNGTVTLISSPTINSFTYAKTNANLPLLSVFGGTVADDTNASMNVTSVAASAVNSGARTVSYPKAGSDVSSRAVPVHAIPGNQGLVTNLTNASFNVTGKIITAITSTTISYAQTGSNVAENNAAGFITNVTNRDYYNGINMVLSTPTFDRITYDVGANSEAAGVRTWLDPRGTVERQISTAVLDVRYRSGWIG